jgi:hypothetical protein
MEQAQDMIQHKIDRRIGQIICATSDHVDGAPRVRVWWNDGSESCVRESDVQAITRDAITEYYEDRAASGSSPLNAHR